MAAGLVDTELHPITDPGYVDRCRAGLDAGGALVLGGFFSARAVEAAVRESTHREGDAFYASKTHNVWLTPNDPAFAPTHPRNRQVLSSKGLIADDQIPSDSVLRALYDDPGFRAFLCGVLGIDSIYPYADEVSSINVHFAAEGMELGWHFDNSSFAVTMLLQAPDGGGVFEYVADLRTDEDGAPNWAGVSAVLDGEGPVSVLDFAPGDLVLFRGREAMHRVTPTEGGVTRMLVVFAFNDEPGVRLSDSALETFYGRPARLRSDG